MRILLVVVVVAIVACGNSRSRTPPEATSPRVLAWLDALRSPDEEARRGAFATLDAAVEAKDLTDAEVIALLRGAPALPEGEWDPQTSLLMKLGDLDVRAAYAPVLEEVAPALRDDARMQVVDMLAEAPADDAVRGLLRLGARGLDIKYAFQSLQQREDLEPRHRAAILRASRDPALVDVVAYAALTFAEADAVDAPTLARHAEALVAGYRANRVVVGRARGTAERDEAVREAGIYLDLFRFLPPSQVLADLEAAAADADPHIAAFAALSLLALGGEPPTRAIETAASSDTTRTFFFRRMSDLGKADLIAPAWRTQRALARADMVQWLMFPTELGRPPDAIELMAVVPLDEGGVALDMYVFRYRTDDGWLAGVAGPYPRRGPVAATGSHTFSKFEPADAQTPEQHVGDVAEIVADWRASQ